MLDKITKRFSGDEVNDTVLSYKLISVVDGVSFAPAHQAQNYFYRFNNWLKSDSRKMLTCNKDAYLSGFHCYLDKEEAYDAMMKEVMTRWNEGTRRVNQIAGYFEVHECQCRNLICEGIQDGYKVIVARENFVWAKPVDYSYLLNREDEELAEVPTKEMRTE